MNDATETAIFLRRYQSWRKGEIDVFYPDSHAGPNPVEISAAIDRAIAALEAQPPCGTDGAVRDVAALASAVRDIPDRIKALGGQRFAYVKLSEVIDTIYAHASQPAAPVAPATVAVPDEVMAALDRMCTPLHESILKGATAASDAASMKVIRDYILATHPQGVRAVPGEYVLVPVNPTREMISAGDAANDGIVSDIYRAMVSQVVKESFTTAVPRVPFSMPDAAVERIYDAARRSFRRFASSVRGQMVTKAGGYEWHVINATLDEVRSMLDASQPSAQAVPDVEGVIEKIVEYGAHRENEGGSYATFQKSEARQHRAEADDVLAEIRDMLAASPAAEKPEDAT